MSDKNIRIASHQSNLYKNNDMSPIPHEVMSIQNIYVGDFDRSKLNDILYDIERLIGNYEITGEGQHYSSQEDIIWSKRIIKILEKKRDEINRELGW